MGFDLSIARVLAVVVLAGCSKPADKPSTTETNASPPANGEAAKPVVSAPPPVEAPPADAQPDVTCEETGVHVGQLAADLLKADDKRKAFFVKAFTTRCTDNGWAAKYRACFVGVSSWDEFLAKCRVRMPSFIIEPVKVSHDGGVGVKATFKVASLGHEGNTAERAKGTACLQFLDADGALIEKVNGEDVNLPFGKTDNGFVDSALERKFWQETKQIKAYIGAFGCSTSINEADSNILLLDRSGKLL